MNRRTIYIAVGAAVVATLVWYVALWSPRKADLSDARKDREAVETQRDELAVRVSRLKAAQKDEPRKRAQVEKLRVTIPDDPNLAAFILDTNDAALKAGIDFVSVAPAVPVAGAAPVAPATPTAAAAVAATPVATGTTAAAAALPAEIRVQLQIEGGYFQVLDFLNRVNDMPRLVVTDKLSISSDEQAHLTVAVNARMFVRSLPVAFGGAPPTAAAPSTTETKTTTPANAPSTASAAPAPAPATSGAKS